MPTQARSERADIDGHRSSSSSAVRRLIVISNSVRIAAVKEEPSTLVLYRT